jgi:hypothetical protein
MRFIKKETMDLYPKFIIEGTSVRLGKCIAHKQLAVSKENVISGGWYHFKDGTFTLFGESVDFGRATLRQLQEIAKNGVFVMRGSERSTEKFKFQFKDQLGEITPLK